MAQIDELITTYLTACEVEGKTSSTVASTGPRCLTSEGSASGRRCPMTSARTRCRMSTPSCRTCANAGRVRRISIAATAR